MPSNDVLQIIKDSDGTVWVNCYKQPPSYFDQKNNTFISFENNTVVAKNSNSLLYPSTNLNGGVYFSNTNGSMFFKNKKLVEISKTRYNNLFINKEQFYLDSELNTNKEFNNKYSIYNSKNKLTGEINSSNLIPAFYLKIEGNSIFEIYKNEIISYKILHTKPFQFVKKNNVFKETLKWYSLSKSELSVITNSGKVIVYDIKNFKLKHSIATQKEINYSYKDSKGTVWISTLNNGLLKFNTSTIQSISKTPINPNFLSIHISENNALFAGNFQGEVLEKNKKIIFHKNANPSNTVWIRAIETFKNKVITVSDLGYCINYGPNNVVLNNKQQTSLKTALKLNDNVLLLGSNSGLFQLNANSNTYKYIKSPKERILSMVKINDTSFYFTANSGVYKYDLTNQAYSLVFSNANLKYDTTQAISSSTIGNLWINTFKGNIYLINKNNVIQFSIKNSDKLPINITKLLEIDKQLWIASKDGMYVLDVSNLPKYAIHKISKSDGLTSNFINDITYKNDSIYLATNNGISILSKNIKFNNLNVAPFLLSLKINNINVPIKNKYELNKDQKNVVLNLAGIDLSGHFKKFQYNLTTSNEWFNVDGNTLNLILKNDENNIQIRAVNENNDVGKKILQLQFVVAIPFYNKLWFWIAMISVISFLFFWFINELRIRKQKNEFEKLLIVEKERNKITADLHDEIGATLSSLQINSTIANRIIEKDVTSAQKVITKIETQAKGLSDKIGDIIWSMKPGKDEFMTLSTRIKNFANEIIGSTQIHYILNINNKVDVLITDIALRKNLIMIIKEGINNAVKYSNAKEIILNLQITNQTLLLEIKDNGIGFVPTENLGNGLANMRKRTQEINGEFNIQSEIGKGSNIIIKLNLPSISDKTPKNKK